MAAAAEQRALGARLDDDVADEAREANVVRPDREQHQIELALGIGGARPRERAGELGELRARRVGAARIRARAGAFDDLLAAKKASADGRARAGERQIGDGDVRALDGKRERGAHLVAVERAMAGPALPARALPRPGGGVGIAAGLARSVAAIAGAAGAVIFRIARQEAAEAEALVGEPHRAVGIAFAGRD